MDSTDRAIAIVGLGAVLPDAPDVASFWRNLTDGRYSICETPTDRWDADLYYDADPKATDKTYSKIGGWVQDWEWEPLQWRLPIPPKVADAMDLAQKWAITTSRQALADFGYPERPLDPERTAVIFGNALGGDFHLLSAARILFPEFGEELSKAPSFQALSAEVRGAVMEELLTGVRGRLPDITEDTMPGELANIVAGRVAALYDFRGPNFVADAACASAMAAISAAVEGLEENDYDAVLTGGIDANMSPSTFVKFCKIGALSATGTRPYADGADGFVMGEGAACFLLKRLADAERDGDRVYAVIRGLGGSSDGRGKGITAPNPAGQQLAIRRAWERAGVAPEPGDLVEGHGTSTKVGDVVEVDSLTEVFGGYGLPAGSIMLGSVKSNIGHLKGAAGAAGLLKVTLALHEKQAPPSVNFDAPNPNIDFSSSPLRVNDELHAWEKPTENGPPVRRAGVSAFGFGGTNFHAVLEEHVPGRLKPRGATVRGAELAGSDTSMPAVEARAPLRGALVIGGATQAEIASKLRDVQAGLAGGTAPRPIAPLQSDLDAEVRLAIDYADADDLSQAIEGALKALDTGETGRWRALRNKGVYIGQGSTGKIAFLFTGQGSQYVNMLRELRDADEVVRRTFDEADEVMAPLLDGPLTDRIFVDPDDEAAIADAEQGLKQTAITQPAVLTVDTALARLFGAYGIEPDMVMGHSLGEYGALVAAGALPFGDALTAVAARGRAMTDLSVGDNGRMAAVFAPPSDVEVVLDRVDGYVVVANLNSTKECVIGGATEAVVKAVEALMQEGIRVVELPVSHAFHTRIVEPAAAPLMEVLRDSGLRPPEVPVVANVSGDFYPSDPDARDRMVEILGAQIGSPVQFVQGLNTLHDSGARVFIEMGPKRALYGMATDVLGERDGVTTLFTNHPRTGGVVSMNRALCAAYALGLGRGRPAEVRAVEPLTEVEAGAAPPPAAPVAAAPAEDRYVTLGRMFADFLDKSFEVFNGEARAPEPVRVGITGASLGLPGPNRVFDDSNVPRILGGDQFITHVPVELRQAQADKRITRLVKGANGEARFETIDDPADVIKLAGRGGSLDLPEEFGYPADRMPALDRVTELAIAAGVEALRDAGIPLVMRYKTTTTGSKLPAGWALPEEMQDDTGIIFGSAFPGYDAYAEIIQGFEADQARRGRLEELESLRTQIGEGDSAAMTALDARIAELRAEVEKNPFHFDRRFLFRVLSMGHSQFAEFIGARGPNTQLNAACASGTQAVGLARDWIEAGRCRRVIVITADDVTTDRLFPWFSSGFLASGAAATDERVEDAAIPFDRRRHGMIIGMGGAALVVEDLRAAAERGVDPICEVLGAITANSAFHGTRLNVDHIAGLMERLVSDVEARWGLDRRTMARHTVFVSHETYTPARGGSASAEVHALRHVFGDAADAVVVANTKGYTGHPMGVGIEDALAVKMLETGVVPPVANFREVDPDLGLLNLSRGGDYPVHYALRLGAGFGSQISMSLVRWTPPPDGARRDPEALGFRHRVRDPGAWQSWLSRATGYDAPEVEIDRRTLRVRDEGPPAREPARAPMSTGAVVAPPPAVPAAAPPAPTPEPVPAATAPAETAPAVEQPAATEAPAPAAAPAEDDPVQTQVLAIVAEQTGYPPDMLDMDLDLEADLGIDTVKQAEMFAAIRGAYDIERDENLALRDYPTLAHAVRFVYEKRPDLAEAPAPAETAPAAEQPADVPSEESAVPVVGSMEAAQTVPRRIPVPRLRPIAGQFPTTEVVLGEGRRVVVAVDGGGVGAILAARLESEGTSVSLLDPSGDRNEVATRLEKLRDEGAIDGLYWLPALDPVDDADMLDPGSRTPILGRRVKALHEVARALFEDLGKPGTFLVSATRLGGLHGYGEDGPAEAAGGAVVGFTKAFARERPEALVKVVDFARDRSADSIVQLLLDETRYDPGVVEVGHTADARWTIGLEERLLEPGDDLDQDTVYVVTGAAGSIVSAIVADLAQAGGGTYWLLDLAEEPDTDDPELARLTTDRDALKRDIFERLGADGARVTPKQVELELTRLERSRSALDAIEAVSAAGGEAHYRQADLRDAARVADVMAEIVDRHGRVDVLLHAAGLEISQSLAQKDGAQFDLVFDVKVEGWYNLVAGLGEAALGTAVAFSSIAGRFGNAGQTDYAAANDLLCKAMAGLERAGARGVAIDWTAWRDIGMATRGSIPTIMREAGIDMLPPEAGIPVVRREITGGASGEVLIAQGLGIMLDERAERIAFEPATVPGPMIGATCRFGVHDGLEVETELDPKSQPFLDDHRIDGTAVLPGVMGIEAMAEAARLGFPELQVTALEDVDFMAPFKFYRDEPRAVRVRVTYAREGEEVMARCSLEGARMLHGQDEPERTTHFQATVRLGSSSEPEPIRPVPEREGDPVTPDSVYGVYFHGPAYRVLGEAWSAEGVVAGRFADALPPNHDPPELPTIASPRLIELAFQTAGLAEIAERGKMGLPQRIDRVDFFGMDTASEGGMSALAEGVEERGYDVDVVDADGSVRVALRGYRTAEFPTPVDAAAFATLRV